MSKKVTIVGAGLVGSLMGLYLARRGYTVRLFESRPDSRQVDATGGRSINLALSCRGITSLTAAGLLEAVLNIAVPMRGRVIHQEDNSLSYQPFGRHGDEYINAIERSELEKILLDALEIHPLVTILFDTKVQSIDFNHKTLSYLSDGKCIEDTYAYLIGADGVHSQVRAALQKQGFINSDRIFFHQGYKELSISPAYATTLAPEQLHLWPRKGALLLGNPNRNMSITGSLFLPNTGATSFQTLITEDAVEQFFKAYFQDAYSLMPHLLEDFFNHPTGNMSTVYCEPWFVPDNCLLMGDAAHGIIPFFGQGMNCAFEDCRILDSLLTDYHDDLDKAFSVFYQKRKVNTDAVALLSMENYKEIQESIRNKTFHLKKQLNHALMKHYPDRYVSMHVLVMFTNAPYAYAKACGELQDTLLEKMSHFFSDTECIAWDMVDKWMLEYDRKLAQIPSFS